MTSDSARGRPVGRTRSSSPTTRTDQGSAEAAASTEAPVKPPVKPPAKAPSSPPTEAAPSPGTSAPGAVKPVGREAPTGEPTPVRPPDRARDFRPDDFRPERPAPPDGEDIGKDDAPGPTLRRPVSDDIPTQAAGAVVPHVRGGVPAQRGPRKARLKLIQVDPWSVMKLGFLLAMAIGIVEVIAVAILWRLLESVGVYSAVDELILSLQTTTSDFHLMDVIAFRRVMGITMVVAVIQVVLLTALATLLAFLYNLGSGLVGGLDVTLAEDA